MKNEAFRQELVVEYVCDHEERTSASQTRFVFWSNVHRPLGPNIFNGTTRSSLEVLAAGQIAGETGPPPAIWSQ